MTDLRPRLAEALRSAEGGEHVVITRHGKPAAALIGADQLERLAPPPGGEPAGKPPAGERTPGGSDAGHDASSSGEASPRQLLERAAAPSLRRIDLDRERLPEKLKPVLGMIRANLFKPRLTVKRIQRALGVGGNDLTTRFGAATGAPIREYLEDRRLESAGRLLVDTQLDVETVSLLVGYRSKEVFSRAFRRRYGVRPLVYREFSGNLSREAAEAALSGRAPAVPRHVAGVAALASSGVLCAVCRRRLEPEEAVRVFEDLAPICDGCARERAPELATLL